MRIGLRSLSVLSVVLALFIGACSSGGDKKSSSAATTAQAATSTTVAEQVGITLRDNFFMPKDVTATASAPSILLTNKGGVLHNFSVPQLGVDQDVQPGKTVVVTVKLPASGTLDFFCKYHKDESGMAGTLKVGS